MDPENLCSRRLAVRRYEGRLEIYEGQCGGVIAGETQFHGYPWRHPDYRPNPRQIPLRIVKEWRARGEITKAEYRRILRGDPLG